MTRRTQGRVPPPGAVRRRDWGLIIYDEVHLLPAPVFRMTADLQSRRRLGLTATLVREDGREGDVFSLIGPKRYDAPWKDIEAQGWIAPADCIEVRVTLTDAERLAYATAEPEERYRLVLDRALQDRGGQVDLVDATPASQTLVIGAYLDQLDELGERAGRPGDPGRRPRQRERERAVRRVPHAARSSTLVVSKVANFSIDLPEAAVAIQVSGTFGSRQEEAQRLGRLLRPKADGGRRDLLLGRRPRHPRRRSTPRTGSGSSPSRATRYRSVDADDLLGRPSSASRLERQDGRRRGAGRAVDLREADPRVARHLAVAGLAAQLAHQLVHLPQARGADRLAVGDQPAVGVDRDRPVDLGGAVGHQLLLLAVGAQNPSRPCG